MPKPLSGGHELLLTHQELLGSGEDHRTLRRVERIVLQRQGQKYKELVEEQKSFIHRQKKEFEMNPALETEGLVASTSSKPAPEVSKNQPKGPQKKQKGPKNHQGKGRGKDNWHRPYPQGYRIPKLEPSSGHSAFNMARTIMEFTAKEKEKAGKIDAKLTKITLDINELKTNDKHSAEIHKSVLAKLELLTNTCDRIESKYHVQDDEMEDFSTRNNSDQLRVLKNYVVAVAENTSQFATHLETTESERKKLKEEILEKVEKIHKNYESNPHIQRHSTPLTEENLYVKESLTPFLGANVISAKDILRLGEWPTYSGEGEYNYIEFIRTIDMLQEDFHIPDGIIVGKLHSLFTRTAKKWYYKMRQEYGKHDWSWWKSEVITKGANNSWRFKTENAFESAIFNSEKDKPLTWFFKQKHRLSALNPDMSDTMINMRILRKCGRELEHAIKCICREPCSTEDYINAMEDIITRTRIGKTWTKPPMESKMVPKISREDQRPEKPVLKCHKCGSNSHLANTCTKKKKSNEVQVIEEVQFTQEKKESHLYSTVSEETPVEDYPIEKITAFFEVTEVHTHLPQYSEDFHNLINIQDARMCKTKPASGKGYTSGVSFLISILMNDIEVKVNLDTGAFCNFVGKDYLQAILPEWKNHLLPIEGVQFSSASNNMYPLGILDTNLVFPHAQGSARMKTETVVMDNCTSQHIILGNYSLNIYGIDINNHRDRYFTIGENRRQKLAFSNMPKQILRISSIKDTY
ncbi:hypothetical protein O181_091171 [Austropuccinia psidii MF-1]|uniref:CCHC-type domain-containing protein n=1 Tax=Austropuccinia psidii MF-1 TaxID=1389203 RepID=A0A9Q3IWW8_9BASI|nr:hypothetical protein [Austropuccinia psidii MF-1]